VLRGKRILNIFRFQGPRTLKPRSKFIFCSISKLNGRKLGFNIPLRVLLQLLKRLNKIYSCKICSDCCPIYKRANL